MNKIQKKQCQYYIDGFINGDLPAVYYNYARQELAKSKTKTTKYRIYAAIRRFLVWLITLLDKYLVKI